MNKFVYTCIVMTAISFNTNFAMENITYKSADLQDTNQLLDTINTQAVNDKDRIVILPKKFRAKALEGQLKNGQLFIAQTHNKIVAYKKMYVVNSNNEQRNLLENEIRCIGPRATLKKSGTLFLQDDTIKSTDEDIEPYNYNDTDTIVYNGADFTCKNYRNKHINSTLTANALELLKDTTIDVIQKKDSKHLLLVFGLVKENAGEDGGVDRTPGLAKHFIPFAQSVQQTCYPDESTSHSVNYYRYDAFMPTFDPTSEECIPHPDDQSIPGFGNILVYSLKDSYEK